MGCGVPRKFEHKNEPTNLQTNHLPNNQSHPENTKPQNAQASKPITIFKDDSAISTPSTNQHPTEAKLPIIPSFKTSSDEPNNKNLNNSLTEKVILEKPNHPDNPSLSSSNLPNPLKSQTLHLGFEKYPHEFDFSFLEENQTVKVIDLDTEKILKELLEN